MRVDSASDGWMIDRNGRYYHLNAKWLEEMYRHQVKPYGNNPAYNRLYAAYHRGDADAREISAKFSEFILSYKDTRTAKKGDGPPSELQEFIGRRRGANRRQNT